MRRRTSLLVGLAAADLLVLVAALGAAAAHGSATTALVASPVPATTVTAAPGATAGPSPSPRPGASRGARGIAAAPRATATTATAPTAPSPTLLPTPTTAPRPTPATRTTVPRRSSAARPSRSAGSAADSQAAAQGTPPGRYDVDSTGSYHVFGSDHDAGGRSTLAVDPVSGATQHSASADSGSQGGSSDQTVRYDAAGVYLVELHLVSPGFDIDLQPADAFLLPAGATTGTQWSWQADTADGKTHVSDDGQVTGTATDTVGGVSVRTLVISSHLVASGGTTVDATLTDHVDTQRLLQVSERTVAEGSADGIPYTADVTARLRSLTPR